MKLPRIPGVGAGVPGLETTLALARRCRYEREHTHHVTGLALRLFDRLQELHGLGQAERGWLIYASLLHDIGWIEGRKGHHKTALRLILEDNSLPLDDRQRRIVGLVARHHRKAAPSREHELFVALRKADRQVVRVLAGLLRVADGLDRMHASAVRDVRCQVTARDVIIRCEVAGDAQEDIAAAEKKGDLFEYVFRRKLVLEAAPVGNSCRK
jgi:exopolyphosphatase/pppGpp-phosphohydrolase